MILNTTEKHDLFSAGYNDKSGPKAVRAVLSPHCGQDLAFVRAINGNLTLNGEGIAGFGMDDLLKPTLSGEGSGKSLYSARALFFTGFFGGPVAVIFLSALNSKKLNRLRNDIIFYLMAIIVLFAFFHDVIGVPENAEGFRWLGELRRTNPVLRYGPRVLGLIFWALSYGLHRKFHKAMALLDLPPLPPWGAGILCSIIGGIIQVGIVFLVLSIRGVL
jgi:hypothetical protein